MVRLTGSYVAISKADFESKSRGVSLCSHLLPYVVAGMSLPPMIAQLSHSKASCHSPPLDNQSDNPRRSRVGRLAAEAPEREPVGNGGGL